MHKFAEKIMECVKSKVEARGIDNVSYDEAKEIGEWVDIAKDIVCYDKDMRLIEAMDEEEKYGDMDYRMGYRGRDSRGRFVHRPGRGRSAGYTPYVHMMPYMEGMYDEYDGVMPEDYRMGYSNFGGRGGNRSGGSGNYGNSDGNSGGSGNYGNSGGQGMMPEDYRMGYSNFGGRGGNRSGGSGNYGNSDGNSGGSGNYGNSGGQGSNSSSYGYSEGNHSSSRYGESYDDYRKARRHYSETKSPEHQKEMKEKIGEVFDDMEAITIDMVKDMSPEDKQKYKVKLQQMMQKIQ